jgi:hypothetical protein
VNDKEQRLWYATFGAAYALTYEAMQREPNTRYPDRYALHRAEHIALCAVEDSQRALVQPIQSAK